MTYFLVLFVVGIVVTLVAFYHLVLVTSLTKDRERIGVWFLIYVIIIILITYPSSIALVHKLGFKYPEKTDIPTRILNNNKESIELTNQINLLKKALENPKELTVTQIEDVLLNSLNYSEKMMILLSQNDSIVGSLKDEIEIQRQSAEESQKIAENLRSIKKDQIESVKFIITEDAKTSARKSFFYGILFSIPIGFLMSLSSSFIFNKLSKKVKNRKKQITNVEK